MYWREKVFHKNQGPVIISSMTLKSANALRNVSPRM